ncbi:MAG: hypothetical protein QOI87_1979 [Bradyrhizobium sp.]|jgi:hypothetical protein|nr:hypothetical protein [Bradyrhizobium sp.]
MNSRDLYALGACLISSRRPTILKKRSMVYCPRRCSGTLQSKKGMPTEPEMPVNIIVARQLWVKRRNTRSEHSALPLKADSRQTSLEVRFVPDGDIKAHP